MPRRGRRNRTPQEAPSADEAAWLRSTDERLGTNAGDEEGAGPESLSPRPKASLRQNWLQGPPEGNLSEAALAQFRGQGDRTRDESNAVLRTGFMPQRHAMIVEGRPVVVHRNGNQKLRSKSVS